MIESSAALEEFVGEVLDRRPTAIALDTEFIPESRYVPQLCLVQVDAGDGTYLIDPLAVDDLAPLRALLTGPLVVVHAGAQDLALLAHAVGERPPRVFDTQIAGSFLTRFEQASLSELIRRFLGIAISKQHTFTHWDHRPLDPQQMRYAADDVAHLLPLYEAQRRELESRNRLGWVEEECRRALLESPMKWETDLDELYRRLPKASQLTSRQLAVLRELHRWRDEQARNTDQRPGNLVADHKLVRIAASVPRTLEELERIRQLPGGLVRRHGAVLLERIEDALHMPEAALPAPVRSKHHERQLSVEDAVHLDALSMVAKIVAQNESIAPATLAKKEWLAACLREGYDVCLSEDGPLGGWRAEVLGPVLDKWRRGQLRFGLGSDSVSGAPRLTLFDEETGLAEAVGGADAAAHVQSGTGTSARRKRRRRSRRRDGSSAAAGTGTETANGESAG